MQITKDSPSTPGTPLQIVPFMRSTFEHNEPSNFDKSNLMTTNSIQLGPEDVIAYGYLRSLLIYVQATGGAAGLNNAVYKEDAPYSSIQELQLSDVNSAQIVGPISGFDLAVINMFGGYAGTTDPTLSPAYVTPATSGNFAFILRVPVEISSRDGLGAITNTNSSSTYKLRIVQAASTDVYSTSPDTKPTVRIRAWAECYATPIGQQPGTGAPQAIQPPALGTTQFWTVQNYPIVAGDNTVTLKRVGNLIRNLVFIFRNATPARSTTNFPDPWQLWQDGKLVTNEAQALRLHLMRERLNAGTMTLPTGVFVYDNTTDFDGLYGGEMRDLWMPTASSTRLELKGIFGVAGTLRVLTNDVVPVGNPYLT